LPIKVWGAGPDAPPGGPDGGCSQIKQIDVNGKVKSMLTK